MSQSPTQAAANLHHPPRYPGEQPMPQRTPQNDDEALKMAKLALQAKDRLKKKRQSKKTGEDGDTQKQGKTKQGNAEEGQQEPHVDDGAAVAGEHSSTDPPQEASQSSEDNIGSPIPWPEQPFAYGDIPDLRLPLKSMYDGTGQWPKRTRHGGKKYSWSSVGFPRDGTLVVPVFEEDTIIDKDELHIMELATDISDIRFKPPKEIAEEGAVKCIQEDNRTIETFKVHEHTVCRVKFSDVDALGKGSPYSLSQVSKSLEQKIDEDLGAQPDIQAERWVTAHVLLSMGGQIGGRTDDYWSRARSLAREQFYLNDDLENEVKQQIEADDHEKDPAFSKMLAMVKKGCPTRRLNVYHQAKRNNYATDHGLLYKVENVDIVLVLDQSDNLILLQCSDVFKNLLTKGAQKLVVQSFETYSSRVPLPFPDMTRHPLHWISFLAERPDLDFRNPANDLRVAKSGVYHFGARCEIGDPNGQKVPGPTKDTGSRVASRGEILNQLLRLRYSALGACTEISKFFFHILEPDLLQEYIRVADEVRKLDVPFATRRSGEPFTMRALLVNQMTYEHQDTGDWHHGFAFLLPLGDFTGGDLVLRELGLQVAAPPGCLQMFRGRELKHSITKWTGRRFVCVNVTHEAVRRWALRSLGEEVAGTPTSQVLSNLAECIDEEPEDIVPEEQREEEMYRWMHADEDEFEASSPSSSEASLPANPERKRSSTSKHRAESSSDASAEASDKDAGSAKRQKKA